MGERFHQRELAILSYFRNIFPQMAPDLMQRASFDFRKHLP